MRRKEFPLVYGLLSFTIVVLAIYHFAGSEEEDKPSKMMLAGAGMPLSPAMVEVLLGERLIEVDPDRSSDLIDFYRPVAGVSQAKIEARFREAMKDEADGFIQLQ